MSFLRFDVSAKINAISITEIILGKLEAILE